MNDRELLELAAKAAGIDLTNAAPSKDGAYIFRAPKTPNWNPLTDDGDALRLAVKLGLDIHQDGNIVDVYGAFDGQDIYATEVSAPDACKATRRAIVRAAAEIGKAMP